MKSFIEVKKCQPTLLQEERVGRVDDSEPQKEHGRVEIRGSSLLFYP